MKGYLRWPIDAVLAMVVIVAVAVVLAGCQVTVQRDDGQVLGQVRVGPDLLVDTLDAKSVSSSSSAPQLR